ALFGCLVNYICRELLQRIAIHSDFRSLSDIRLRTAGAEALHHSFPPGAGVFVGLLGPGGITLPQRSDAIDNLLVQAHPPHKLSHLAPNVSATAAVFSCNRH